MVKAGGEIGAAVEDEGHSDELLQLLDMSWILFGVLPCYNLIVRRQSIVLECGVDFYKSSSRS